MTNKNRMSLNYELIPFEKICRTCLLQANEFRSLYSIDESTGETLRLFEMLVCCASVQVCNTYYILSSFQSFLFTLDNAK